MSGWDFDWRLGPKGGTLTAVDTLCEFVRFLDGAEVIGSKRGSNVQIPHRHGTLPVAHKFNDELLIALEVGFRYTDSAGAVTDPDGEAGHVYSNKQEFEKLLFGVKDLATLRRTLPSDTWQIDIEPVVPSAITQERWTYVYLVRAPEAFWRSTTQKSATTSPVAVGGNAPVGDGILEVVGGTDVVVTMTADGATVTIEGATPAGGVKVDLAAGTVTKITGGADYHEFVSFNRPYAFILEPGDNAWSSTGTPTSVTWRWYDRLR